MALVVLGEVIVGGSHDPLAGTTVVAERGGGAWSDGRRLVAGGLASVASGGLSAFVEIDGGPWDYAAGSLAVREAGGGPPR
ncbi:inositol monophosphatase family protein [Saccharothrix sp. ALI-22-I]|uniref:inositol monophosphatase family protein n=1 Tax=Saccharothrix sp. ALI-22-I TaxID=1933778 RepID=UPI0019310635|nr:inositol monophosphatase family protein [Saccharothrix sp. ALI-22-I]